jgi:DNA-directed RNA polymerase subunit alpha
LVEFEIPKIECEALSEEYGRFRAEPLERGFGVTLGNALRRVLLSSLEGAAITWVRIEGIQHEFSSIPHVKEDAMDFLLNVKEIRLRPLSDRPGKLTLQVAGEGGVCAGDIQVPPDFEIVNPELHLATLDSVDARLSVEFNVEHGKGYRPAGHDEGLPIGMIPVDAIFTPVRKVSYDVEPLRVGQETNYDRLILEVWTDKTISPVEAVSKSAQTLIKYLSFFSDLTRISKGIAEKRPLAGLSIPTEQYNIPIDDLNLSVRTRNCLKRANITKVGELLEMSEEDLLTIRNFGQKSLQELRERLGELGFVATSSVEEKIEGQEESAEEANQEPVEAREGGLGEVRGENDEEAERIKGEE